MAVRRRAADAGQWAQGSGAKGREVQGIGVRRRGSFRVVGVAAGTPALPRGSVPSFASKTNKSQGL